MVETLERRVEFYPGYDRRSAEPKKNYGIGGGTLAYYVIGPKGAVQFTHGMNLWPAHVREELLDRARTATGIARDILFDMRGYDVGYHAREPQYEGQTAMKACHLLGCDCYYDGSSLRADEWFQKYREQGTKWLWPELEQEYHERFDAARGE